MTEEVDVSKSDVLFLKTTVCSPRSWVIGAVEVHPVCSICGQLLIDQADLQLHNATIHGELQTPLVPLSTSSSAVDPPVMADTTDYDYETPLTPEEITYQVFDLIQSIEDTNLDSSPEEEVTTAPTKVLLKVPAAAITSSMAAPVLDQKLVKERLSHCAHCRKRTRSKINTLRCLEYHGLCLCLICYEPISLNDPLWIHNIQSGHLDFEKSLWHCCFSLCMQTFDCEVGLKCHIETFHLGKRQTRSIKKKQHSHHDFPGIGCIGEDPNTAESIVKEFSELDDSFWIQALESMMPIVKENVSSEDTNTITVPPTKEDNQDEHVELDDVVNLKDAIDSKPVNLTVCEKAISIPAAAPIFSTGDSKSADEQINREETEEVTLTEINYSDDVQMQEDSQSSQSLVPSQNNSTPGSWDARPTCSYCALVTESVTDLMDHTYSSCLGKDMFYRMQSLFIAELNSSLTLMYCKLCKNRNVKTEKLHELIQHVFWCALENGIDVWKMPLQD